MTYLSSIPQADDVVAVSQGQLLGNFQALDSLYALDHYAWDDATVAYRGHHKNALFIQQAGDPPLVASAGTVYSKLLGTKTELFYENSAGEVSQITHGGGGNGPIRAWVCFDAKTLAIDSSGNVSSVTYLGGVYTVTFSAALPTANYGVLACSVTAGSGNNPVVVSQFLTVPKAVGSVAIVGQQGTSVITTAGPSTTRVSVIIVGG